MSNNFSLNRSDLAAPAFTMKCVLIFILCFLCVQKSLGDNFTFTYTMAMRCKEHLCTHGYSYETFYQVQSDARRPNTAGTVFEMHLAILASSNGHILLSTTPHPEASDPVYEIVVGGGVNKFTELRRNLRRNARASAKTLGILSPIEFRAFYIRISEDGVIEFGREGDQLPVISYNDVSPLTIKYFSFAAWNGVEAKFLYDCPPPNTNAVSPDSREVEPQLSNSDALKRTLLLDKQPNLPPGPNVNVKMDVIITSIHYDAYSSKLTTGLAVVAVWTDDAMAWNPDKFNGTKSLKFFQGQIWKPTFFVFNSHDMGILDSKNSELITMNFTGEASLYFQTKTYTWCYETASINRWPNDQYACPILIGAWEPHEIITLSVLEEGNQKLEIYTDIGDIANNEWDLNMTIGIVSVSEWADLFTVDNQTNQSDRILINVSFKRQAASYKIVFYTPLLVLTSFILMSFWNDSLKMSRVWFYTGCVIVCSMGLCYVDYLVPCHSIPSIMILYTTLLMGILIALLIQVTLMTSVMERVCKSVTVQSLLTAKWFRTIFFLPVMKTCRNYESFNEAYASQEDDDSGVIIAPRNGPVEEMEAEEIKYGEREELAEALDKLLFFVYSVTFAIMLAAHY